MSEPMIAADPAATPTAPDNAVAMQLEADRKAAQEKANVLLAADAEFQKDVKAAADKRNKVLEQYPDESLGGTVGRAWDAVRGEDPCYAETSGPFREKLATHAESVQRTGVPPENPSPFETEFGRLWAEQQAHQKKGGMAQQQTTTSWADSKGREAAVDADYKGDEGEKGKLAKSGESDDDDDGKGRAATKSDKSDDKVSKKK